MIFGQYSDEGEQTKEVKLRYVEKYDSKIREEAIKIEKELKKDYSINGLEMVNSLYHYGGTSENIYNNDLVLYRFDDLKAIIEKYSTYKIIPSLYGAGGTPFFDGNNGDLGIFKDGILYGIKHTGFSMNHVFYVDKDAVGTMYEKAEKIIKNYFNNEVEVKIETDPNKQEEYFNDEYVDREINKELGKTAGTYKAVHTPFTINGKGSSLLIVEVDKDTMEQVYSKKVEIKSNNADTGININTTSYHVPIDVSLSISNVLDKDYVKKFIEDNKLNLVNAFDINLKKITDGTFVKVIPEGVEVYIPILDQQVGDKINIYYIKDDGTKGEVLAAEVVEINGKLYAKFTTNHFSTYAVEKLVKNEETSKDPVEEPTTKPIIDNPQTYDNFNDTLMISLISILGLIIGFKKIKNN